MLRLNKRLFVVLLAFLAIVGLSEGQCIPRRDATFRKDDYYATWTADMDAQIITFHVVARTTGYVGLGLSRFSGMSDADIVIGGIFPNGTTYFGDYYSLTNSNTPVLDESQDWFLDSASENGTHTELVFHRAFDTEDAPNDHVITDALTTFIWAYGSTDDIRAHGSSFRNMYLASILNFPNCFPPPEPEPCTDCPLIVRRETLDPKYILYWYQNDCDRTLHFHVIVEGTGFVGFGFSYAGSMFIGDVVIGGVGGDGSIYFGDYHTMGNIGTPILDDSQDWTLDEAKENATHTELKFSRAFDTGDDAHDSPINTAPVYLIWSFGMTDNLGYHFGNRGARLMQIVQPGICPI